MSISLSLTADLIYTPEGFRSGIWLDFAADGTILSIGDQPGQETEYQRCYEGILCPGFTNAHCHLELSYLRGKISRGKGFADFGAAVTQLREYFSEETQQEAINQAVAEMVANGIVAVGDISNGASSFEAKSASALRFFTFIELLGFDPQRAPKVWAQGLSLFESAQKVKESGQKGNESAQKESQLNVGLAAHAPYSVSAKLIQNICAHAREHGYPTSIHMMESPAEIEFFSSKTGPIVELYQSLGLGLDFFEPTGENSLRSVLPLFDPEVRSLLVHNTLASAEDLNWASTVHPNLWWCLCPGSNLFIENTLPDFSLFSAYPDRVCLGTDSLASAEYLNLLDELKIVAQHAPEIPTELLLQWATSNPANFFKWDDLGSFSTGKRPGINLLTGISLENPKFTDTVSLKPLHLFS